MTLTKRQRKRAATAGAVVMMLGVLHLSTKDASGTPAQCEIGHSNPPIVGLCDPTTTPPSTVVFEVTPYKPGEPTMAPPVQTTTVPAPATTTVTLAPPVSIVATGPVDPPLPTLAVDTTTTTERIEEDDPRFDCKTMGNKRCGDGACPSRTGAASGKRCGPPVVTTIVLALPATS